jgi:mycoredoxin
MLKTVAQAPSRILMYATPYCGDTRLARRVLDEMGILYDFIDIRQDQAAARLVEEINNGFRSSPTIIFPDGSVLVEPSERELRSHVADLQAAGHQL